MVSSLPRETFCVFLPAVCLFDYLLRNDCNTNVRVQVTASRFLTRLSQIDFNPLDTRLNQRDTFLHLHMLRASLTHSLPETRE